MTRNPHRFLGSSIACLLALCLAGCATVPGGRITLQEARQSLQQDYPALLKSFDLHQGTFTVDEASWDGLSSADRAAFLSSCSRSRHAIVRRAAIRVQADGDLLATYDGSTAVMYGTPSAAVADRLAADESASAAATSSAVLLSIPRPIYPPEALKAGLEGTVLIRARIGSNGMVEEVEIVEGGIPVFNPAAVAAVREARFRPLLEAEVAEAVWVEIPMRFSILGRRNLPDVRGPEVGGGLVDAVESRTFPETPTRK